MRLQPRTESIGGKIPVFQKVWEHFTGGFFMNLEGAFTEGVELPAGSLLKVNEETRTATLIKTAVLQKQLSTTGFVINAGHHFKVGDYVSVGPGLANKAHSIASIAATALGFKIVVATALSTSATAGVVMFQAAALNATSTTDNDLKDVPNALSQFRVEITDKDEISAVFRATAYKKRIQAHIAAHIAGLPETIQLSESY